ncbi:hypothetical protein DNU06_09880 [Putridiphycobacter roseus]|uniref:Carboxypeptidase-like regulatory domain-containing protein n=1 Tax=Putridiphycobacter roseus TaxID=2219161 RepID=A0A2W1NQV2_9FLAO|nr:hypothetical protein [Putridiphycobacter roseus]PZE17048.1 hypothetical protein DNU06_09880 [Putridiphycobacter roseus]
MKLLVTISIVLFSLFGYGQAQADAVNYNDSLITIKGRVIDSTKMMNFYDVMVMDKSIGRGVFGRYDGSFSITVKKSAQIAVSVEGYKTQYFSFANRPYKAEYNLTVYLKLLSFTAKVVDVKPLKTLAELKEERATLEKRVVPQLSGVNAIQSPITALYMAFSKREKTKRMIAEMEYKDQQTEVVKEVLKIYVNANIIDLRDDQFESFMQYLNLNDEFLKHASDYELVVYIKYRYRQFESINARGF